MPGHRSDEADEPNEERTINLRSGRRFKPATEVLSYCQVEEVDSESEKETNEQQIAVSKKKARTTDTTGTHITDTQWVTEGSTPTDWNDTKNSQTTVNDNEDARWQDGDYNKKNSRQIATPY